jgi:hypothetical protein
VTWEILRFFSDKSVIYWMDLRASAGGKDLAHPLEHFQNQGSGEKGE